MPASRAFSAAAAQDLSGDLQRQVIRYGGDVEGEEGFAAHGVHIREAVGCGDGAIIVRVVHHGSEEVRCDDQRARIIQPPDGGVIGTIQTHQQVRMVCRFEQFLHRAQNLRQGVSAQFGRSTRAGGKAGQADLAPGWMVRIQSSP